MLEMALSASMLVAHHCQRMDQFLKVRMSKLCHLILRYHQLVLSSAGEAAGDEAQSDFGDGV